MKYILTGICFLVFLTASAQVDIPLVGNKDGKWTIFFEGKELELPATVHYVSSFDDKNLAVFSENNQMGIIHASGKIIHEPFFKNLKAMGSGLYQCYFKGKQTVIDFSDPNAIEKSIDAISRVAGKWYRLEREDSLFLFHTGTKLEIPLESDSLMRSLPFGYIVILKDSLRTVYSASGETFQLDEYIDTNFVYGRVNVSNDFLFIQTASISRLILAGNQLDLPKETTLNTARNYLVLGYNQECRFINRYTGEIEKTMPYDEFVQLWMNDTLGFVRRGRKWGLYSYEEGELISPRFDGISTFDGRNYFCRNGSFTGMVSRSGRILVPIKYVDIAFQGEYSFVYNAAELVGMHSMISGKLIIPCRFDYISYEGNTLRAVSGDMTRIVKLDEKHNVLSSVTLDNTMSMSMKQRFRRNDGVDTRLLPIGWFTETHKKFDKDGFFIGYIDNWGFKDANDSLLVPVKHAQPKYINGANYTLLPQDSIKYRFGGVERTLDCFLVASNKDGHSYTPEKVFKVDTLDLVTRSYARMTSEKGMGIIDADGKMKRFLYIGSENHDFIRYCESGELVAPDVKNPAMNVVFDANQFDYDPKNPAEKSARGGLKFVFERKDYFGVRIEEANWNFLDRAGQPVFKKDFDFVQPYYKERAIVKRKGWGVVDRDTTIIPFKYSSITRVSEYGDTMFLLKRGGSGHQFYDTTMQLLPNGISSFIRNKGNLSQVMIGKRRAVINQDYQVVSGETKSQKLMEGDWFYSKRKGVITAYDMNGTEIGVLPEKPEKWFWDDYFIIKKSGKYGVLNGSGEVVIDFKYKEITFNDYYVFAFDGVENLLFNSAFEVVKKCKDNKVVLDPHSSDFLLTTYNSTTYFDGLTFKKKAKFKEMEASFLMDGRMFQSGKNSFALTQSGERVQFNFELTEVQPVDCGYLLKDKEKTYHLYDSSWEPVNSNDRLKRLRYLGERVFTAKTKDSVIVFNIETGRRLALDKKAEVQGDFTNPYILISEKGKKWFVNTALENDFNRFYLDAVPYNGNFAAIQERQGWTVIHRDGSMETLPTYKDIQLPGPNLIMMPKHALYGLADNQGKILLPAEFKEIEFVQPNLIRTIHNGDIQYFDASGNRIEIYK